MWDNRILAQLLGAVVMLACASVVLAGGGEQLTVPQGATERVWGLVTDEALTLGLVMVAGILSAIGVVGLARLAKRKPRRSNFGVLEGFAYQTAYDDWHHLMQQVATFGGLGWIFALELVALKVMAAEHYGTLERVVVALTPALIGCWLVGPAYNYIKKKGREWGIIAQPAPSPVPGAPGDHDNDLTRPL